MCSGVTCCDMALTHNDTHEEEAHPHRWRAVKSKQRCNAILTQPAGSTHRQQTTECVTFSYYIFIPCPTCTRTHGQAAHLHAYVGLRQVAAALVS
jgi:hypothetical protein